MLGVKFLKLSRPLVDSTGGHSSRGSLPDNLEQEMEFDPVTEAFGHWADILAHQGQNAARNSSPEEVSTWLY